MEEYPCSLTPHISIDGFIEYFLNLDASILRENILDFILRKEEGLWHLKLTNNG